MSAPRFVVMFSSGAGSWAAARRIVDEHGTDGVVLLFADVLGEDADNYRFLEEAAAELGAELVRVADGRTIWDVFRDERFLGNTRVASCSKLLKQRPARRWLEEHADPEVTTVVVGIGWDESHRLPAVVRNYLPYRAVAPLCDPPYVDRAQVLADLRRRGVEPPRLYREGFSHANCAGGCVKAGVGHFTHLLRARPATFAEWEANEQDLRDYLGRDDVAILRDRTGGQVRPLTLRELRGRVEAEDDQLDLFDLGGCGCFVDDEAPA